MGLRLTDGFRHHPLLLIPLIGTPLIAVQIVALYPAGLGDFGPNTSHVRNLIDALYLSLMLASPIACARYIERGAISDLKRLRPTLTTNAEQNAEIEKRFTGGERWGYRLGILVMAVFGIVVEELDTASLSSVLGLREFHPKNAWLLVNDALLVVVAGSAATHIVRIVRAYYEIGRDSVRIDLLRVRSLRPFASVGLRTALCFIWSASLISFAFLLSPTALLVALPPVLVVATICLAIPSLGLNRAIVREKASAVEELEAEISRESAADRASRARLLELVQYRDYLRSVPVWPIDSPILVRLTLYFIIPFLSWVAAALVERGVDAAIR